MDFKPEINLDIKSEEITAKPRKLDVVWTYETVTSLRQLNKFKKKAKEMEKKQKKKGNK